MQDVPHLLHVNALLAVILLLLTLVLPDCGLNVGTHLRHKLVVLADRRVEGILRPEVGICSLLAATQKSGIILGQ